MPIPEERARSIWTRLHLQLQQVMQEEIEFCRNILDNLHYEEYLITQRKDEPDKLLILYKQIEQCEEKRCALFRELFDVADNLLPPEKRSSVEKLLEMEIEGCESILLYRQLTALKERIKEQASRNDALKNAVKKGIGRATTLD